MASWGAADVGDTVRATDAHPTKSAITGLVGAVMGLPRDQLVQLSPMRFAVRVDLPGQPMTDYHTVAAPAAPGDSRADELKKTSTIVTRRYYMVGAWYTVAIWSLDLPAIANALQQPKWTPYLGRKACPVCMPLDPRVITADTLASAFGQYEPVCPEPVEEPTYYWDEDGNSGLQAAGYTTRPDGVGFKQRQEAFNVY
jgi:CRISPR system Cascade subunit CasD